MNRREGDETPAKTRPRMKHTPATISARIPSVESRTADKAGFAAAATARKRIHSVEDVQSPKIFLTLKQDKRMKLDKAQGKELAESDTGTSLTVADSDEVEVKVIERDSQKSPATSKGLISPAKDERQAFSGRSKSGEFESKQLPGNKLLIRSKSFPAENTNESVDTVPQDSQSQQLDATNMEETQGADINEETPSGRNRKKSPEKQHKCRICLKTFTQKCWLKRHQATAHNHSSSFRCDVCSKSFKQKEALNGHMRMHNSTNGAGSPGKQTKTSPPVSHSESNSPGGKERENIQRDAAKELASTHAQSRNAGMSREKDVSAGPSTRDQVLKRKVNS